VPADARSDAIPGLRALAFAGTSGPARTGRHEPAGVLAGTNDRRALTAAALPPQHVVPTKVEHPLPGRHRSGVPANRCEPTPTASPARTTPSSSSLSPANQSQICGTGRVHRAAGPHAVRPRAQTGAAPDGRGQVLVGDIANTPQASTRSPGPARRKLRLRRVPGDHSTWVKPGLRPSWRAVAAFRDPVPQARAPSPPRGCPRQHPDQVAALPAQMLTPQRPAGPGRRHGDPGLHGDSRWASGLPGRRYACATRPSPGR